MLELRPPTDPVTVGESVRPLVEAVSHDKDGVAVGGYDTVAYFEDGRAVKGRSELNVEYAGVVWRFASEKHRKQFLSDAARYIPQFGGYCAYAVAKGYTATADPTVWRVVDGKLYLNYNRAVQRVWEDSHAELIELASKNWPSLHK